MSSLNEAGMKIVEVEEFKELENRHGVIYQCDFEIYKIKQKTFISTSVFALP